MKRHLFALAASALTLSLAAGAGVSAQTRVPQTLRPAAVTPAVKGPAHRVFGTLESVTGDALVVRLRNGRNLRVDATQAFALKRVAEPLFRGKPTVVEGTLGTDGTLYATAVRRAAPQSGAWGTDM